MRYNGVDLHRRLLVACVIEVRNGARTVIERLRWTNRQTEAMLEFLQQQRPFEVVIEATVTYDWLPNSANLWPGEWFWPTPGSSA